MNKILLIFIIIPCIAFSQIFQSNIGYKVDTAKWSVNGINIYNKNQGGNVGINTTTPTYRLDVKGASYLNDSIMVTKIQNTNNVEAYNICHYSLNSPITGVMHIATNIVAGGTIQANGGTVGATTSISATAGQRSVRFQVTGTVARRLTNN